LSIDDSTTEAVIQRMIEAMQKFINEEEEEGIMLSSVTKRHFQLQIKTLQNAPRDLEKLGQIIKAKERENGKARHFEDTQILVRELEMLKFELFLVQRSDGENIKQQATKKNKSK
jgi:hypothetical protein